MGEAFVWWLTLEILGLAAFPVAAVLMRALPDRGYATSKILGLLIVGWLAYTPAMIEGWLARAMSMPPLVPFGRLLLALCTLALALFSLWLLLRNGRALLDDLAARFRTARFVRYVIAAEALFALLYIVWAVFRSYNPEIFITEKFMDFGFMNSILKSTTFPPNDMWLSGYPINYYYFGYVLMASLTSLSGVPSEIGYNLANITLFSLSGLGAFGLVYNLIAGNLTRRPGAASAKAAATAVESVKKRAKVATAAEPAAKAQVPVRRPRASSEGATATAARTASVVLDEAGKPSRNQAKGNGRGQSEQAKGGASPGPTAPYEPADFADAEVPKVPFYVSPYIFAALAAIMVVAMGNLTVMFAKKDGPQTEGNGWRACFLCAATEKPENFNWWNPSRVIRDYTTQANGPKQAAGNETINEFPAFSFLLGDMHPHVMALPIVLLALTAAYALSRRKVLRSTRWSDGLPPSLQAWVSLLVVSLIIGTLYAANTWDYPTYLLITLVGLALPYISAQRRSDRPVGLGWLKPWVVQAIMIIALSLISFIPFHLTFKSLVGGQPAQVPENLANMPVVGFILEKLGGLILLNTADKTILGFAVIFGIFLVALLGWLLYEFVNIMGRRSGDATGSRRTAIVFGVFFALTFGLAFFLKFPLFALLLPVAVISLYIVWQEPARTERNFALILLTVGALVGLAVEIFYLRDVFSDRMNTLFKFYYQMWVLWSAASAYGLWRVLYAAYGRRKARVDARGREIERERPTVIQFVAAPWALVFLLLALSGMMYSVYGTRSKLGQDPKMWGLDGMEHVSRSAPNDYNALKWLKDNATGNDVVMECCRDEYNMGGHAGRVSAYTGVPTILAWDGHENQWRGGHPEALSQVAPRRRYVNSIYQGKDPEQPGPLTGERLIELLDQYSVDYVFVGAVERGQAGVAGQFAEERLTPDGEKVFDETLIEAYSSGDTVIYRVPAAPAGNSSEPAPPSGLFDLGRSGSGKGKFNAPRGIARDASGNFFVADTQNLRIQKFDKDGKFVVAFGGRGDGDGQFNPINDDAIGTGPGGVAVDKDGNVYVADTWNHRIQKFDNNGKFLVKWGGFINIGDVNSDGDPDRDSKLYGPRGVAAGPDGNVYVTDTGNKRVLIFAPDGKFVRKIDSGMSPNKSPDTNSPNYYPFTQPGELNEPMGITVDAAGNVYVADTNNKRIQKFDNTGKPAAQWPVPGNNWDIGPYLEPFLTVDGAGNVYASAPTGKTVLKFGPDGQLAGQKNKQGTTTLQLPTGIVASSDGTVYVVDTNAHGVANLGTVP